MGIFSGLLVILGIALLIVNAWMERPEKPLDAAKRLPGEELGSPGPRGERSDEYVGGGGAGGAEGEQVPPSFQAPADGGIGGAEGGEVHEEARPRPSILAVLGGACIVIGLFLLFFPIS